MKGRIRFVFIGSAAAAVPSTDFLAAHNKYRTALEMRNLTWSDDLAKFAESWATTVRDEYNCEAGACQFGHGVGGFAINFIHAWGLRRIEIVQKLHNRHKLALAALFNKLQHASGCPLIRLIALDYG